MGSSYHQFCPVAKAMELLDERWTLLLLRELIMGSEHFNDLRAGSRECHRLCSRPGFTNSRSPASWSEKKPTVSSAIV